jgi:hypothetical protein
MLPFFLLALIPATWTILLPPRWLLLWLPLFWGGTILSVNLIDSAGDKAIFGIAVVFAPLWLVNLIATGARMGVLIAGLIRDMDRGY